MVAALQEGRPQNDLSSFLQNVQENWRRPTVLKTQFEKWVTTSPPLVEALLATVAGGAQVGHTVLDLDVFMRGYSNTAHCAWNLFLLLDQFAC